MDNLIKKGYVRRVPCDIDKRVIYAEITKAGEEIAALYKEDNIKMFIDFLKKMPDVQIEPIYKALNHWCEFLQKANTMLKNTND
jgi:DNA-binding MarR family transcriptional regulator